MKKLSEYENEEALEVLADLIDPLATIALDKELVADIRANFKNGAERGRLISDTIKKHKKEVIRVLAALERTPVEEYKCNLMTLPAQIMNILNDADLMSYFLSSAETKE